MLTSRHSRPKRWNVRCVRWHRIDGQIAQLNRLRVVDVPRLPHDCLTLSSVEFEVAVLPAIDTMACADSVINEEVGEIRRFLRCRKRLDAVIFHRKFADLVHDLCGGTEGGMPLGSADVMGRLLGSRSRDCLTGRLIYVYQARWFIVSGRSVNYRTIFKANWHVIGMTLQMSHNLPIELCN